MFNISNMRDRDITNDWSISESKRCNCSISPTTIFGSFCKTRRRREVIFSVAKVKGQINRGWSSSSSGIWSLPKPWSESESDTIRK